MRDIYFAWIWVSGKLAASGEVAQIFDRARVFGRPDSVVRCQGEPLAVPSPVLKAHAQRAEAMSVARKNLDNAIGWRIENRLFTEWRVGFYGSGIAATYVIAVVWIIGHYGLSATTDGVACTDFSWIWLSSKLARSNVALIYDYSAFSVEHALSGLPSCNIEHFDYPPTLLLLIYPLGLMPYLTAFAVWMLATLALYLGATYAVLPRRAVLLAAATPVPVLLNVLLGHNGFVTAGLVGLALASIECRRPWMAGIFLGLLTYKPQFGFLFPVALLALREWRAICSAAATSVIFGLMAALAFGFDVWPSFTAALSERGANLNQDPTLSLGLVSPLGFLLARGINAHMAWIAQLALTAIMAVIVYALWRRPLSYSLKAAALAIASVTASPHAFGYDLCILSVAVAFLVKDGLSRGFLPGDRSVMLMCWLGLILPIGRSRR